MSEFKSLDFAQWIMPGDESTYQFDVQLSGDNTVDVLQALFVWTGVTGGDGLSYLDVEVFIYTTYFGVTHEAACSLCAVDTTTGITYSKVGLASGPSPSDGSVYLRVGNYENIDGRNMKVKGERLRIKMTNQSITYSGGTLSVIPHGWSL